MLIIFLGSPGSGKGTVSYELSKDYKYIHISTGDIFRAAIKSGSEIGNKVKSVLDSGNLVNDELTWEVAKEALEKYDLNKEKIILDGFPRNMVQVKLLDDYVKEIKFNNLKSVYFEVSDEEVIKRLTGRLLCSKCGKGYHKTFNKPKVEGKCDLDNELLIQRKDDQLENVKTRLETYEIQTKPLIIHYKNKENLITINSEKGLEKIITEFIEKVETK